MKKLLTVVLLSAGVVTVQAAGLGNLFNDLVKKPAPTPQPAPQAPAPQAPKPPVKK
jgi:hypothetical protein